MAVNRVMVVFTIASMLMWILPIAVLQAFNWNLIPGLENMSPQSRTLWSGALAVFCVNVVIAAYIFMALFESTPATEPQPDPVFLRRAKESVAAVTPRPSKSEEKSGEDEPERSDRELFTLPGLGGNSLPPEKLGAGERPVPKKRRKSQQLDGGGFTRQTLGESEEEVDETQFEDNKLDMSRSSKGNTRNRSE